MRFAAAITGGRWLAWRRAAETAAAAAVVLVGYHLATSTVRSFVTQGGTPSFYQSEFGPAVSLACGYGFRNLEAPELRSFLTVQSDAFSCTALEAARPGKPLNPFQRISRYLLYAAAVMWVISGVTWGALVPLYGVLGALTAGAIYGLCRLVMPCALAVPISCAILVSPLHLGHVPHLRDYAKAPFLLVLILIMGALIRRTNEPPRLLALAGAAGVVFGVGLGFRNDLLIAVLPLLLAIACAAVSHPRTRLLRVASALLFVAVMLAVAFPVVRDYRKGSNTAHVALLGLTTPFSEQLGLRVPLYNVGHAYLDEYIWVTVRALAEETEGLPGALPLGSPDYDRISGQYLVQIAKTFPGDFVTRAYAAALKVVVAPFRPPLLASPPWAPGWLAVGAAWRARVAQAIDWNAVWMVGLAVLALLVIEPRAGLIALAVLVFFAGGAAAQYQYRHTFHLEVLPWLAIGGLLASAVWLVRSLIRQRTRLLAGGSPAPGGWLLAIAVTAGIPAALWGARQYQTTQVRSLFERYVNAPREVLRTGRVEHGEQTLITIELPADVRWLSPTHPVQRALLAAEFGRCDYFNVRPRLRYRPADGFALSREFKVPIPTAEGARTYLFFPVIAALGNGAPVLEGLEFRASEAECLSGVQRIRTAKGELLVDAVLPPDWRDSTLHQTLPIERAYAGGDPAHRFASNPEGLDVQRRLIAEVGLLEPGHVEVRTGSVLYGPTPVWTPRAADDEVLVVSRPDHVSKGMYAVVAGQLLRGSIAFELWDSHDRAIRGVRVERQGEFTCVLVVPADGQYRLAVSSDSGPKARVKIRRFGWTQPR